MKRCAVILMLLYAASIFADSADTQSRTLPPDAPEEFEVLREALHDQATFERQMRVFDRLHIGIARALYIKAREHEEAGEAEEALAASAQAQHHLQLVKEAYDMGLARFGRSAVLHNYYGELLHDFLARPNEAAQYWRRAVQLDPKLARAHGNFGMYAMHNGMYGMGLDSMDRALELEPNNPDLLFNMTQVYLAHFPQIMQHRKWDRPRVYREAMKLSARAARLAPHAFDVVRDYALNYFLAEDFGAPVKWRDAARAWEKAREAANTDAERFNTWLNEARVHIRNNDSRRAQACLEQARAIWPDSPLVEQLLEDFKN